MQSPYFRLFPVQLPISYTDFSHSFKPGFVLQGGHRPLEPELKVSLGVSLAELLGRGSLGNSLRYSA